MKPDDMPVISHVFESGADDRVFDSLLLIGPIIIALITALDRTLLTEGIAMAYITLFVTYVLYQGIR